MTLRQRYEKRLWSLILENESAASEANTETPKVKLGKIAQKIKDKAEIQSFFRKCGDFHGANPDISECC
jgi:hypothetical protein